MGAPSSLLLAIPIRREEHAGACASRIRKGDEATLRKLLSAFATESSLAFFGLELSCLTRFVLEETSSGGLRRSIPSEAISSAL
jgi:hypothetical protein